jgi:hypothetical protein
MECGKHFSQRITRAETNSRIPEPDPVLRESLVYQTVLQWMPTISVMPIFLYSGNFWRAPYCTAQNADHARAGIEIRRGKATRKGQSLVCYTSTDPR